MAGMFDTGANALLNIGQGVVQPQTNQLENIGTAQRIRNEALNNRLLQAQYDAEMAQGNALLGATDANGNTNYAKARAAMAADPAAAYGAAKAMREQNAARMDDLANTVAGKNAVGSILSYVAANPDQPHLYAAKRMAKAIFPGQNVDAIVNQIAQHPDGIAGGVAQIINSMQPEPGQQANVYGTPGATVNNGQKEIIGTQQSSMPGPKSGQFNPVTTIQRQVSPDSNAELVPTTVMINGRPTKVWTTAGAIRGDAPAGFTGRSIDTSGSTSAPAPAMVDAPAGTTDQVATGQNVQNALAAQQGDLTQNVATLENLNGLLGKLNGQQFRGQTMAQIANNLSKLGLGGDYATLHQEIDKAATQLRKQMVEGGGFPHTNAGLADLEHMSPSADMTPTAARALTNELLTAAQYQQGRQRVAASVKDPTKVMGALAAYDQAFDPRFATIQRLGPEEGREYARSHISDPHEYAASVRRMAQAQRDSGYDYGLTPAQIDRILGAPNGR